ncbi:DUF6049 family protein [Streptomyces caniscabiei]|uniref:DUF6049 family protein n=1 Tax=Streptomyces caniscabiei TaxID=2746961 RepID=A0ABU4MIN5_9ACTN|nr:DUF6049 family protein [Streptomyces caniscabiei]MBE4734759.1 hypothetical protein [Streptomyces caniscabiei]MBE4753893.1 hypothetical protein [Streptomyces caniscabiei]MBE4767486.1 hypothetical protein [Streptomyces caniscabiei]MBE4783871.1 hypothetical protein [Streptomyces caniscabiei]MBE4791630.1 hypothetical protein [Streptomyces caniscabiei]
MAEAADFQGTSPSPARRWMLRTGAILAGAPLLAGLFQLPAPPSAQAAPKVSLAEATGSNTVEVSLDSLSPSLPTDGDTVTVSGSVTNKGKQTVTDAHVGLRVAPAAVTGRSSIDDAAKRTGFDQYADGPEVGGKYVEKFSALASGVAQPFTISVPVKELDLGPDGVYQLGVSLSGRTGAAQYDQVLGIQRTFLPWQPDEAGTKTKTTYLWPLISTTHLTAETGPGEQQTPVFLDDELAKEISAGGRLEQMLTLGKDLDVTWVIDPDLLASVVAMTGVYQVRSGGTTVPGKNQAVAKEWLAELETAVQGEEVIALPFADPDLAALAHNGKTITGSLSRLKDATDVASDTVQNILRVKPETDFAWPVNGAVDPSIVKVAISAGADKVIARSDSLQENSSLSYTPNAARPIGGGTTAVVADARLSTAFQGDMTKAESSTLAVQRFLAQSLTTDLQNGKQRSVVIAPQRMPTASQAQTMAQALTALEGGNWSQTQDLSAAAAAKPDPNASTKIPSASAYPSSLRKQALPKSAFEEIRTTQTDLDRFKVILSDQSRVVTPFGRTMDREMSTSWRGRSMDAAVYRNGVQTHLNSLTEQVRLIEKSETKLSGRSATIPVTVQNNLVQGVDNLTLRLTSNAPKRLKIGDMDFDERSVDISGGHSESVKFTTNAEANGPVTVVAQLYTVDGEKYGDEVRFTVNVTEITPTVMLVIAGGVLLLVLAGFRMYTQRKRAAARLAAEGPPADAEDPESARKDGEANTEAASVVHTGEENPPAKSGTDEPEHPSDPAPDTAPESADPSGTGERVDR